MKTEQVIELLESATPDLLPVAEQAATFLRNASEATIQVSETPKEKAHWLGIYRRRKAHCDTIGVVLPGLAETIHAFEAADGNLRAIAVTVGERTFCCWEDETHKLAGCVVG